jgi:hypothetical protein
MQKLTGISSGKNNKSCRIFHHKPNKLVLHFSDFYTIFYTIYKNQPNHKYYLSYPLQKDPRKDSLLCNVAPGAAGRRGLLDSGELAAGLGRGRAGEGPTVTRVRFGGSDGGWSGSGERHTGGQGRWPPRLLFPASWGSEKVLGRLDSLRGC